MVNEYIARFYLPASRQWRRYSEAAMTGATGVAQWKAHVRRAWGNVRMRWLSQAPKKISYGTGIRFEVGVHLDGLDTDSVVLEMILARPSDQESQRTRANHLELTPELCGRLEFRVRLYPHHPLLTHPHEMGMMIWL
jgi:starch phosphorylase